MDLSDVADRLRSFAAERDWERFHDPKNLAMALAAEAGELLEVFQWRTTEEVRSGIDPDEVAAASEELADVMIFLVRLADVLEIDLGDAVDRKIAINAERYSVEGWRRATPPSTIGGRHEQRHPASLPAIRTLERTTPTPSRPRFPWSGSSGTSEPKTWRQSAVSMGPARFRPGA